MRGIQLISLRDIQVHFISQLLSCQVPKSAEAGKPAHDEHLFIIIHQVCILAALYPSCLRPGNRSAQVYELWFKQILHEMDSIITIFKEPYVPESSIGLAVERLTRVVEIQKILIQQLDVLETMSPVSDVQPSSSDQVAWLCCGRALCH